MYRVAQPAPRARSARPPARSAGDTKENRAPRVRSLRATRRVRETPVVRAPGGVMVRSTTDHPGDLARPGRCLAQYSRCGHSVDPVPCCAPWRCFRKDKRFSQCRMSCDGPNWDCNEANSTHGAGAVLPQPALHLAIVLPIPATCSCKDRTGSRCECLCNHVVRGETIRTP
jgi:hypothetical protein